MFSNLKNIILDLGGVIVNLDYSFTSKAFNEFGFDVDKYFTQAKQMELFDNFEKGKIDPGVFREFIRERCSLVPEDHLIDKAWNAMVLDVPAIRIELIKKLNEKYRVFLLSNTNVVHMDQFHKYVAFNFGEGSWKKLFEKIYYSYELGMRKPDSDIYEFVLKDSNLKAEESLFIDDNKINLDAPSNLGIKVIHATKSLEQIVEEYKLL